MNKLVSGSATSGSIVGNGQSLPVCNNAITVQQPNNQIGIIGAQNLCDQCKLTFPKVLLCSRCKMVKYCSTECQRNAWKTHKTVCKIQDEQLDITSNNPLIPKTECQRDAWKTHKTVCKIQDEQVDITSNNPLIPNDDEVVCKLRYSNGVRDVTQKKFKELIKATYVCTQIFSQNALELAKVLKITKTEHRKHVVSDLVAIKYQGDAVGYGLVALKKIPKGQVICSLGGELSVKSDWDKTKHTYRQISYGASALDFVADPSEYMGLGGLCSDGPPNAMLDNRKVQVVFSEQVKVPFEKVVISIKDIEPDEEICIDYGEDHIIKRGRYHLSKDGLNRLKEKFSKELDFSLLNKFECEAPWEYILGSSGSTIVKAKEIKYLLSTPYALVLLHLHTELDPVKTLESLKKMSPHAQTKLNRQLNAARYYLTFLSKLPKEQKQAFIEIAGSVSQAAFLYLCKAYIMTIKDSQVFSSAVWKTYAEMVDKLDIMCFGIAGYRCWKQAEEEEFKKLFLTEKHQKEVFADLTNPILPKDLQVHFTVLRNTYYTEIQGYLSPEEKTLLDKLIAKQGACIFDLDKVLKK